MSKKGITFLIITFMIIILAGCNSEETPTIDPNQIYTQAAETVAVQRTNTAIAEME